MFSSRWVVCWGVASARRLLRRRGARRAPWAAARGADDRTQVWCVGRARQEAQGINATLRHVEGVGMGDAGANTLMWGPCLALFDTAACNQAPFRAPASRVPSLIAMLQGCSQCVAPESAPTNRPCAATPHPEGGGGGVCILVSPVLRPACAHLYNQGAMMMLLTMGFRVLRRREGGGTSQTVPAAAQCCHLQRP
jgi:hypothetical protein